MRRVPIVPFSQYNDASLAVSSVFFVSAAHPRYDTLARFTTGNFAARVLSTSTLYRQANESYARFILLYVADRPAERSGTIAIFSFFFFSFSARLLPVDRLLIHLRRPSGLPLLAYFAVFIYERVFAAATGGAPELDRVQVPGFYRLTVVPTSVPMTFH